MRALCSLACPLENSVDVIPRELKILGWSFQILHVFFPGSFVIVHDRLRILHSQHLSGDLSRSKRIHHPGDPLRSEIMRPQSGMMIDDLPSSSPAYTWKEFRTWGEIIPFQDQIREGREEAIER